ncbi:hypothetical protein PN36_25010 [Candidatus Thiomargarita nelsonii]|uniref:Secreted protein n=1 Tax=Candidatus Thiomargarita nelsonii TaxID=1003181 RepID=A0A0A6PDI2_9GAMM|nr:hypothetical protein PN36_25010 [Candidatus Thiomargarita nelsonii]
MMKKANLAKWMGLWLLVVALMGGQAGNAESYNIKVTPSFSKNGMFVTFYLKSYENVDFVCYGIRAQAKLKDNDGRMVWREALIARNIILPAHGWKEQKEEEDTETNKRFALMLVEPRIVEISDLSYRCEPIPTLVSPADGTVFNKYPRQTKLVWTPVPTAKSYTVEIDCYHCCQSNEWCTDVGKKSLQVKRNLKTTSYTFHFVGAQPGRWRVWAIYADGRESQKTPWWEFKYLR